MLLFTLYWVLSNTCRVDFFPNNWWTLMPLTCIWMCLIKIQVYVSDLWSRMVPHEVLNTLMYSIALFTSFQNYLKLLVKSIFLLALVHLYGIHIHKLFFPGVNKNIPPHNMQCLYVIKSFRSPDKLRILQTINFILYYEYDHMSTELVSVVYMVLKILHGDYIKFGGVLLLFALYIDKLPPVCGKLFSYSLKFWVNFTWLGLIIWSVPL